MGSLVNKIRSMIHWGSTTRANDDSGDFPIQQIGYMGKISEAVMWFPAGFHSNVDSNELALILSVQGNSEAKIGLPGTPAKRPKIATGEVVVYHPKSGSKIYFKDNGSIVVTSSTGVTIDTPTTLVTGDMTVEGQLDATGGVVVTGGSGAAMNVTGETHLGSIVRSGTKNIGDTHTHDENGSGGGTTDPPNA